MKKSSFVMLLVLLSFSVANASTLMFANWNTTRNADYSADGDALAYVESGRTMAPLSYTQMKFGAGSLDFTSDSSNMYYSSLNNFNSTKGTIEFWYDPTVATASGMYYLVSITPDNNNRLYLRREVNTSGQSRLYMWGMANGVAISNALSTAWSDNTTGTLALNTWHHIAYTWDYTLASGSRELVLYVDGVRMDLENTLTTDGMVGVTRIEIGRYSASTASGQRPGGYIDSLRISDDVVYSGATYIVPTSEWAVPEPGTLAIVVSSTIVTAFKRRRNTLS